MYMHTLASIKPNLGTFYMAKGSQYTEERILVFVTDKGLILQPAFSVPARPENFFDPVGPLSKSDAKEQLTAEIKQFELELSSGKAPVDSDGVCKRLLANMKVFLKNHFGEQ